MGDLVVAPSGFSPTPDYNDLDSAFGDPGLTSGNTITIKGDWTGIPDSAVTADVAGVTVTCEGDAYHDGNINKATAYAISVTTGHALTISASTIVIEKIIIKQDGTGTSDEGVRISGDITTTLRRCIIWADTADTDQDGIYVANDDVTVNVLDCIIMGFSRGGIHYQNHTGSATGTFNIRSCTVADNGHDNVGTPGSPSDDSGGGIKSVSIGGTKTFNIHNTISISNDNAGAATDYEEYNNGGSTTWNISNSIDGDNSIASVGPDTGGSNFASRTATDNASPGAGDWVVFEDVTGAQPWDVRLKTSAENDAEEAHSNDTAHTLTITANADIAGTTRTAAFCIGAHEIGEGGGSNLFVNLAGSGGLAGTGGLAGEGGGLAG